jgi:hypothetical protein
MTSEDVTTKRCIACGETKPLTREYWRRQRTSPDDFMAQCKECASAAIKEHYRGWKMRDVLVRGEFGVKCVLWSPKCGWCPVESEDDMSACWRLDELEEDDDRYPVLIE